MANQTMPTPSEHVAHRIRMYRNRQHMTIDTLSQKLHVSPSTVSKYENSKLSIDISTLFEIAEALNVSVFQLVDFEQPKKQLIHTDEEGFFQRSNLYYVYQYNGTDMRICQSVLEKLPEPDDERVRIYYDVQNPQNYTESKTRYEGFIICHELITSILCTNPYGDNDDVFISVRTPQGSHTATTGLLAGIMRTPHTPYATKIVVSQKPLALNDDLKNHLLILDDEKAEEAKRSNNLTI